MKDKRINCYSIMMSMEVHDYLELIEKAYKENGGIEGQRQPLKTKSAKRIRETMKNDIEKGTVLPPLVIGCVIDNLDDVGHCLEDINNELCKKTIYELLSQNTLSIIDGMQRTTALKEICDHTEDFSFSLRIELWITNSANSLIYRMLVLNTGQISWGLKKQLEVVFSHVKKELQSKIDGIDLIESTDRSRATKPKKYQLSHLVELYLSYSTRKHDVNLNEKVTEEFAKQDIIERSYDDDHLKYFIGLIKHLVNLDEIFFKDNGVDKRLFGDQYARIGFIVSLSKEIFGRPGKHYDSNIIAKNYTKLDERLELFITKLKEKNPDDLNKFYQADWLKDSTNHLNKKQLPEFYERAFKSLIEEDFDLEKIDNMEICWRA
jgi:hypothetical protein